MNNGWIKIHRKLLDNKIFSSQIGLKVWLWCLLRAGHQNREVVLGFITIKLKKGQFIFGRTLASQDLKIKQSTLRNWMLQLKKDNYIDIKPTNKYSIVTICNWDSYQGDNQQKGQQIDNRLTTTGQQPDTNKNVKKVKNVKNIYKRERVPLINSIKYLKQIPTTDILEFLKTYQVSEKDLLSKAEDLINYCEAHGKKYRDYKALLRNAVKKDFGLKVPEREYTK